MATLDDLPGLLTQGYVPEAGARLPYGGPAPRIDVDDYGQVKAPLRPAALRRLLEFAEPAAYGKGEQTLTDPAVRDTWQIPSDLVTVDWNGELDGVLESARAALGLPATSRLRAEFHSLLVYETGQFFVAHQDSQKHDDMLATLVVTMPSPGTGGALLVHDGDATTTFTASRDEATLVVFYADRLHEVKPVRSGHRLTMTYNLLVSGDTRPPPAPLNQIGTIAALLTGYFATARHRRFGTGEPERPTRLAYLLDHEYPQRGLSLTRLKGSDATAAALLGHAADRADCEVVLALTQVHEVRDGDDIDGDLLDDEIEVTHWLNPDGFVEPVSLQLTDDITAATATARLRPYAEEYQGYMGNYGETTDRWYQRAALLVWPRSLAFANRAEVAPQFAMRQVLARLRDGDTAAESDVAGLARTWGSMISPFGGVSPSAPSAPALLSATLPVAALLADATVAEQLLAPFAIDHLQPEAVEHVIVLTDRHGEGCATELLRAWFGDQARHGAPHASDDWLPEVPDLARGLSSRPAVGREFVALVLCSVQRRIEAEQRTRLTESVRLRLEQWGEPLAAVFEAIGVLDDADLRAQLLGWSRREPLVDALVGSLRVARAWTPTLREAAGMTEVAAFCALRLRERLQAPQREPQDWSMKAELGCECELCAELTGFLTDSDRRVMEWPLAGPRRQHLHAQIDRAELPLTHVTRRQGRPFTLVLTKTDDLFAREQRVRESARNGLAELRRDWKVGPPAGP